MDLTARKLMIVDDVKFTRLTLSKIVGQFGRPTVFEAGDGESALALLQIEAAGTDCVITDLDMPKLDGLGLLKAIREGIGGVPRDTKVVLLTGHSELDLVGPALQLELDGFLAKPVSRKAMEACLQRLFEPAAATQRASQPESAVLVTDAGGGSDGERKLALTHVPAGAELARDILFSNGRLLLRTGTRLSERGRDRLNELLTMAGVPAEVWIRTSP